MLNSFKNAMKRLPLQLDPIAKSYHHPVAIFYLDALLAHLCYGVTPNQYVGFQFYKKNRRERATFYTLRSKKKYEKALNDPKYYSYFWDKSKFNATFADFIHRDWLLCETGRKTEILDFLHAHPKVIVKPTNQSSGKGIHVYRGDDTVESLIGNHCMLEEFVIQHPDIARLNPTSVNTVRVFTMIDKAGVSHILTCSLRVGGYGSEVDNYHSGGVGYPLDVKTGVIMGAGADIMGGRHLYHPGTQAKAIGFQIPAWKNLIQFVQKACLVIPTARLIAWDVAVLEDGFEMIEGNYDGDPGIMQTPSGEGQLKRIAYWSKAH